MFASALTLGLVGLATASPLASRQVIPNYPETSQAKGFRLAVNVTDLSRDLSPSVNNWFVTGFHVGAATDVVGLTSDKGRVFYANGTTEEWRYGRSNVLSDGGSEAFTFPMGLQLKQDGDSETVTSAYLNVGEGDAGIFTSRFPEPYSFLLPGTWAACNESLPYYSGQYFVTLKQAETTVDEDGTINDNVPEGCAPIRLVPECAKLPKVPAGSLASHKYALDTRCYKDVSALDWTQYGP